jgi:hypothetical protein
MKRPAQTGALVLHLRSVSQLLLNKVEYNTLMLTSKYALMLDGRTSVEVTPPRSAEED